MKNWNFFCKITTILLLFICSISFGQFVNDTTTGYFVRNFQYQKPTTITENGLVAAYNMTPQEGGVLDDISGNGNDGTIYNSISTLNGLYFDGSSSYTEATYVLGFTPTDAFSVAVRIKMGDNLGGFLCMSGKCGVYFSLAGEMYVSDQNLAKSEASTTLLTSNVWTSIVVTYNNGTVNYYTNGVADASNGNTEVYGFDATEYPFLIGNRQGGSNKYTYLNATIDYIYIYSKELTLQDAKDFNNQYATRASLYENFKNNRITGVTQTPIGWKKGNGTYKIEILSDNYYMECVTDGTISILYDTNTAVDASITYDTGSGWVKVEDTLANLISSLSWLSLNDSYLTFDLTTGDKISSILINKGIAQ